MFQLIDSNGLLYYKIEEFEKTGLIKHCFTTRKTGVSKNEYESLNLRINCDDDEENIKTNFKIICDEIGVNYEDLVFSNQVHEDKVVCVTREDLGNGIKYENKFKSADALVCNQSGVPLITFFADCVPLYFLDVKNKVIALAHSGWKGTVKNIASKTIEKMKTSYKSLPEDILCAIGPSIGECHFEVGEEVFNEFSSLSFGVVSKRDSKMFVNLQKTIENQMLDSGILKNNITVSNVCTYCRSDLLFSHRKTNGKRGSLAAIMELN